MKTADLCREAWDQRRAVLWQEAEARGMDVSAAQRPNAMEDENRRLKLLVELSVQGEAQKEVIRKDRWSELPI